MVAAEQEAAVTIGAVEVWEANWPVVQLFTALPWIEVPLGGRSGLDWVQAEAVVRWTGAKVKTPKARRRLWEDLRACEAGALAAYDEARERARERERRR